LDEKLDGAGVSAAAYHGGDLNGVSSRELMEKAESIFKTLEEVCKSFVGKKDTNGRAMNSATEKEVSDMCKWYSILLRNIGAAFSILRRGWGEATDADASKLKEVLVQCELLWTKLGLSWTPKWHALREHSVEQLMALKGYKEFQEDWVEAGHQTGNRDMKRFSNVKNFQQKATSLAKVAAARANKRVRKRDHEILASTKRKRTSNGPTPAEERKQEQQETKANVRNEALENSKTISPTKVLSGYQRQREEFGTTQEASRDGGI
jgi:hypothetical protein